MGTFPIALALLVAADPTPLPKAHAHNDYEHERPLLDALSHGFTSAEADVYLVDGELLVAHFPWQVKPEHTLRKLYLEPLRQRVHKNGGKVYPDGPTFTLLIDIKNKGEATYAVLHEQLAEYKDVFVAFTPTGKKPGAVLAVISGDRPTKTVAGQKLRYAAVDGRPDDLKGDTPADLIPLISQSWGSLFKWRGEGPMPTAERRKLRELVETAHAQKRRVRFWATPDRAGPARTAVWEELLNAKADLINTDDLKGLSEFLRGRE